MFSIVPVLDELVELSQPRNLARQNLSLLDEFRNHLGCTNEVKTIEDNNKCLTLAVNCESFKPEHIKVSIKDNYLNISGEYETKDENSFVKRSFSRRFLLPDNAIQDKMNCSLSQNGLLKITIPKQPKAIKNGDAVNIPIQYSK